MAQQALVHQQNLWKTFLFSCYRWWLPTSCKACPVRLILFLSGKCSACKQLPLCSIFPDSVLSDGFVIGLSAGSTVLVGQAWGARNLKKCAV